MALVSYIGELAGVGAPLIVGLSSPTSACSASAANPGSVLPCNICGYLASVSLSAVNCFSNHSRAWGNSVKTDREPRYAELAGAFRLVGRAVGQGGVAAVKVDGGIEVAGD